MAPLVDIVRQTSAAWAPITGPNGSNPLRSILDDLLDPAAFRLPGAPELVVAATSVRTGEARLFHDAEITVDVLLASACLPQLFASVKIDGESYWDGGYASNPPLRPLIEAGVPPDVLIVRSTPLERPERPSSAAAIQQRVNEITFGAALRSELRSLALGSVENYGISLATASVVQAPKGVWHGSVQFDGRAMGQDAIVLPGQAD